tara:strand:- start:429 stop:746 length:318 start_codon:yes stop_codon:yes gene_type:complete
MTTSTNRLEIANTILSQLGGAKRLAMMTGSKSFVALESGVSFKLGKGASNGINHVRVELTADDLYTVTFLRVWGTKVTTKSQTVGAYSDMLVSLFESATGFFLTF